ncbi:MAG: GTP 3',8-cyclase MoaA [Anaerolineae bacterium]
MSTPLSDSYQRPIRYLRISVTDRCNLRCQYCMPAEGIPLLAHGDILRYEEITRFVGIAAQLGIVRIRLTGGEPLARKGLAELVRQIAAIPAIEDLSLTTNGTLLAPLANELAANGLQRVNISLDSLRPERYRHITRGGILDDVLSGITAGHTAGLVPIKINVVVVRGQNDDELVDFARCSLEKGWHVRFIEKMPIGEGALHATAEFIAADEMRQVIEESFGPLLPDMLFGNGPARYWRIPRADGTIGFISALSQHFCPQCNRLRLSADGRLMPCLFSPLEYDVRTPLHSGASDAELSELLRLAVQHKPVGHHLGQESAPIGRVMSRTGG